MIKGVRLTSKNCFLTVNDAKQCETILKTGLTIREKPIKLENLWEGSTILQVSAVPHYVADDQIVKAISRFADVIGIYFTFLIHLTEDNLSIWLLFLLKLIGFVLETWIIGEL